MSSGLLMFRSSKILSSEKSFGFLLSVSFFKKFYLEKKNLNLKNLFIFNKDALL